MNELPGAALLFGGQGDDRDFAPRAKSSLAGARPLLDRAGARLGLDLAGALEAGSPVLLDTEAAQPALVAVSVATALALRARGFVPSAVAGHSLGELPAFAAAGCISPEQAVDLACLRGEAMARAARAAPGAMIAIVADDVHAVEVALATGRLHGTLGVAAHNAPARWILSGDRRSVEAVERTVASVRLSVAGAWHSSLMETARTEWLAELRKVDFRPPRRPLLTNRTGRPVEAGDDLAELLAGQLTGPIRWVDTLQTFARMGISEFALVGSERTLRGLCRATLGTRCKVVVAERAASQAPEVPS